MPSAARASPPAPEPSPHAPFRQLRVWPLIALALAAAALGVVTALQIDRQAVVFHEHLFNEQQARHALLVRHALEAQFHSSAAGVTALASHAAGCHELGDRDADCRADLLRTQLIAFPEHLAYVLTDASGEATVVQADETPAGQTATSLARAWVAEYGALLAVSAGQPFYPPPQVTSDALMVGVMAPVSATARSTGVLVAVTDLQPLLNRYLTTVRSGEHGAVFVLDGHGTVVYDQGVTAVGRSIFAGMGHEPDLQRVARRMLSESTGIDVYWQSSARDAEAQSRRLIAWDTVELGEHRLVVALSAVDSEVNSTLDQVRLNAVQTGILVAAVLLVLSVLFFRARQRRLEERARDLQAGIQERTAALDSSEQTLRKAFDLAPVGFAVLGLDGHFERANRSMCETLGYAEGELQTLGWADLLHPGDRDGGRAVLDGLVSGRGIGAPLELRHLGGDGRIVHGLFDAALMRSGTGRPDWFLVQLLDITERKQAEEQLRQRTTQLETLRRMALDLARQLDLGVLLQSVVAHAERLLPGTQGGLYLYDAQRDELEWVVSSNPMSMVPLGSRLRRGEGLSGKVLESGRAMVVDDYEHWAGRAPQYAGYHFHAVAAVPVCYGESVLGVLDLVGGTEVKFSEADAALLDLFGAHAAIALHNAQLLQREHRAREFSEALAAAAAAVGSTLELNEVFDRILEQVQRVVGGSTANVALIQDGVSQPVRWRGYDSIGVQIPLSRITLVVADTANLQRMVDTGDPVVVDDTATFPGWVDVPETAQLRSYVGAPIRVGNRTVGFLNIDSPRPGEFGAQAGERLVAFAHYAAIAIENARLYEQARRDAATAATLVEEINHRVKNNLSAILGLLYVEQSHARWRAGGDCGTVLQDLAHRIQGLAALHSVLSETGWTALRLSDLSARIVQTVLGALSPDRSIRLEISPSSVLVTPAQAHNLALVIHELAANALEHAWVGRPGGRLSVRVAQEGDTIALEVRDDGAGYPQAVLDAPGLSVGLFLVRNLVEQGLRGRLQLANDGGAVATVHFECAV